MKYTQAQLEKAFDLVKNPTHWKDPINAVAPADQERVIHQAVIHFTGTVPTITSAKSVNGVKMIRVKAIGYRNGPCGDY